jgi:hypothetical protein
MIIDYDQIAKRIESNWEIQVRHESVNASKIRVTSIGTTFVPEVNLYAQGENENVNKIASDPTAGFYANLNLFNGLRDVESNKISKPRHLVESKVSKRGCT